MRLPGLTTGCTSSTCTINASATVQLGVADIQEAAEIYIMQWKAICKTPRVMVEYERNTIQTSGKKTCWKT
jgi:hypothetical protein